MPKRKASCVQAYTRMAHTPNGRLKKTYKWTNKHTCLYIELSTKTGVRTFANMHS